MILEHHQLDINGKCVFESMTLDSDFLKTNPMPDEACFLQIKEGAYTSVSEIENLSVSRNEAVLMKCGNYLSRMFVDKNSQCYQAVAVHFYPDVLKKVYGDKVPEFLKTSNGEYRSSPMQKVQVNEFLDQCMNSIYSYFKNSQIVTQEMLEVKLKEVILLLLQTDNRDNILTIFQNLFSPRAFSFKEIIDAHLYEDTSVEELSQLCNMSSSTFKREFQKQYQDSPAKYMRRKKLERAGELLIASEMTLTEIAMDIGFNDSSVFSKAFKTFYNKTPSEYRANP